MLSLHLPGTDLSRRSLAAFAFVCLTTGACATSGAMHRASEAEQRQNYDLAVVEYAKALRLKPDDGNARAALERSKLRASQDHFSRARRLAATGKLDQALVEYQVAAELNPSNGDLDQELQATRNKLRAKVAVAREGKTELQTLVERARDLPPPGMDLPTGVKMPASLVFRDASSRDVFTAISRLANVSLIFDSAFRDTPVTVDLRNTTLEDALGTVAGATRSFFRVTAPKTIVVIPDTPAKRREYRGGGRQDLLLEQRRSQGDDGSAAHGARRAAHFADDGAERADDQGLPRADRRGGACDHGDRQDPPGSDHRRRADRGRSHETERSTASKSPRPAPRPRG